MVVGSVRSLFAEASSADDEALWPEGAKPPRTREQRVEEIQRAAEAIGSELGRRGHTVIVGSDDLQDVDPYVVKGVLSAEGGSGKVEVHVPLDTDEPYQSQPDKRLKVVPHSFPDWDVTNMEALRDADAVLALHGRVGVVMAGIQAWINQKPVVPVAGFGGGGRRLWGYASSRRQEYFLGALNDEEIDALAAPWGRAIDAPRVVDITERLVKAAQTARTPSSVLGAVTGTMLFALLAWVIFLTFPYVMARYGITAKWDPDMTLPLLFLAVSAAGLLGGTMQTMRAIRDGKTVTPRAVLVDFFLGIAAGVVMAMLYLLAQIAVSGQPDPALKAPDYIRVTLVVSMASLFASLYLDAALARFDAVKGSVFEGKYGNPTSS
jgi:hypothetical protein